MNIEGWHGLRNHEEMENALQADAGKGWISPAEHARLLLRIVHLEHGFVPKAELEKAEQTILALEYRCCALEVELRTVCAIRETALRDKEKARARCVQLEEALGMLRYSDYETAIQWPTRHVVDAALSKPPPPVVPKELADQMLAAIEWAIGELGKHSRPSPLDMARTAYNTATK